MLAALWEIPMPLLPPSKANSILVILEPFPRLIQWVSPHKTWISYLIETNSTSQEWNSTPKITNQNSTPKLIPLEPLPPVKPMSLSQTMSAVKHWIQMSSVVTERNQQRQPPGRPSEDQLLRISTLVLGSRCKDKQAPRYAMKAITTGEMMGLALKESALHSLGKNWVCQSAVINWLLAPTWLKAVL